MKPCVPPIIAFLLANSLSVGIGGSETPNFHDSYGHYHQKHDEGETFGDVLAQHFPPRSKERANARILALGCARSRFYDAMVSDGYGHIHCIDTNADARSEMLAHWEKVGIPMDRISYEVGDIFKYFRDLVLKGDKGMYDMILDKGVLEVIPYKGGEAAFDQLFNDMYSALKPSGVYVQIGPFHPPNAPWTGWRVGGPVRVSNWKWEWDEATRKNLQIIGPSRLSEAKRAKQVKKIGSSHWKLHKVVPVLNHGDGGIHVNPKYYWVYFARRLEAQEVQGAVYVDAPDQQEPREGDHDEL